MDLTDTQELESGATPASWKVLLVTPDWGAARDLEDVLCAAGFIVMRFVRTAQSAVSLLAVGAPDVIVMDYVLCEDNAFGSLQALTSERRIPMVFLSSTPDAHAVERVAESFGSALLVRPFSDPQLVATVILATISARRPVTSGPSIQTVAERLLAIACVLEEGARQPDDPDAPVVDMPAGVPAPKAQAQSHAALTPREREVVDLIGHGARVASIAKTLGLSTHTVRNHLKSIYRKLDVRGQHELYDYVPRVQGCGTEPSVRA